MSWIKIEKTPLRILEKNASEIKEKWLVINEEHPLSNINSILNKQWNIIWFIDDFNNFYISGDNKKILEDIENKIKKLRNLKKN